MIESSPTPQRVSTSVALVKAYLSNNSVPPGEVPSLLRLVHDALQSLADRPAAGTEVADLPNRKTVRKSVGPDGLVSFINGKTYKTLKRHLTVHDLDPDGYRQRFGLPWDYPMVAAAYSAKRSQLAKEVGLGRLKEAQDEQATPPVVPQRRRTIKAERAA